MIVNAPLVSVVMITYNHEKFIQEAIKGVLMQNCDFDIEFIIANDKSTDKTEQTIAAFLSQHNIPSNIEIKCTNHKKNKGMMSNFLWAIQQAQGKYIALCEGDDYWTHPSKLKKQIDFLENHPGYAYCYHLDEILMEIEIEYKVYDKHVKEPTTSDLIKSHFIPSESLVFRNILNEIDIDSIKKAGSGDIPLVMQLSLYGNGYLIEESMSVYRLNGGGVTSSAIGSIRRHLKNIEYYKHFNSLTKNQFQQHLVHASNVLYNNCFQYGYQIGDKILKIKFTLLLIKHLLKNHISKKQLFVFYKSI